MVSSTPNKDCYLPIPCVKLFSQKTVWSYHSDIQKPSVTPIAYWIRSETCTLASTIDHNIFLQYLLSLLLYTKCQLQTNVFFILFQIKFAPSIPHAFSWATSPPGLLSKLNPNSQHQVSSSFLNNEVLQSPFWKCAIIIVHKIHLVINHLLPTISSVVAFWCEVLCCDLSLRVLSLASSVWLFTSPLGTSLPFLYLTKHLKVTCTL